VKPGILLEISNAQTDIENKVSFIVSKALRSDNTKQRLLAKLLKTNFKLARKDNLIKALSSKL